MGHINKAVFLDRDGVILNDTGHYYVYKVEDVVINEGIIDCLKEFRKNGFLLIMITNQGGISKGVYTKKDVEKVHNKIKEIFGKEGIEFNEIYYCPHHPEKEKCICRKPDTQLIEKAIYRFDIDPGKSFFIGDTEKDIKAAEKAGLIPVRIKANENPTKYCTEILKKRTE